MTSTQFDEWIAQHYDTLWPELRDPAVLDCAVDFLAELVGDGAALELGVGTGRLALPLSQRGIHVHGIEQSAAMVAALVAKQGTEDVEVTLGDFATARIDRMFSLAYLVRNTITNLTSQEEQAQCFRNLRARPHGATRGNDPARALA